MKVLLVSDLFPPVRGGLENHVDSLANGLVLRGHDVHVATLTHDPAPMNPNVTTHRIPTLLTRAITYADSARTFHPPLPDALARRAFAALLRAVAPDVIHGHSWLTVSLPRSVAPVLLTAHDYGLICPKRTLVREDGKSCEGPSLHCTPCASVQYGRLKSAALGIATPVGRHLMRHHRVIAVSERVARSLRAHVPGDVRVVPNFIPDADSPLSASTREELPAGPFVLFAGDPSVHKGVDTLLELWAGDSAPAVPLVLAATRPLRTPLPANVSVVQLKREQMHTAWSAAAVAVVPSVWPDPFPTVALEAMAAGTPVVASAIGGLVEMFDDGVQGFHVGPGDGAAVGGRLNDLLGDDVLRAQMGAAAKAHVNRYRAANVIPQIESVYQEMVMHKASAGKPC